MAASIRDKFPDAEVKLIGGGKGDFIVKDDGRELWNKRQMGDQFPEHDQVLSQLT